MVKLSSFFLFAAASQLMLSASLVLAQSHTPIAVDPFLHRNGEKEALADLQRGKRLKLYYSWMWGEGLRLPTVGIEGCWEDRPEDMAAAKGIFVTLPQLTLAEDGRYHPEELSSRDSAWTFARAYNLTMWRHKRREILRLCPEAGTPN